MVCCGGSCGRCCDTDRSLRLVRQQKSFDTCVKRTIPFPSPRPFPSGSGCSEVRPSKIPAVSDSPTDWRRFSLSLRETAGVRRPVPWTVHARCNETSLSLYWKCSDEVHEQTLS